MTLHTVESLRELFKRRNEEGKRSSQWEHCTCWGSLSTVKCGCGKEEITFYLSTELTVVHYLGEHWNYWCLLDKLMRHDSRTLKAISKILSHGAEFEKLKEFEEEHQKGADNC